MTWWGKWSRGQTIAVQLNPNVGIIAPGIYIAVIKVNYTDGTSGTTTQKIVIAR